MLKMSLVAVILFGLSFSCSAKTKFELSKINWDRVYKGNINKAIKYRPDIFLGHRITIGYSFGYDNRIDFITVNFENLFELDKPKAKAVINKLKKMYGKYTTVVKMNWKKKRIKVLTWKTKKYTIQLYPFKFYYLRLKYTLNRKGKN